MYVDLCPPGHVDFRPNSRRVAHVDFRQLPAVIPMTSAPTPSARRGDFQIFRAAARRVQPPISLREPTLGDPKIQFFGPLRGLFEGQNALRAAKGRGNRAFLQHGQSCVFSGRGRVAHPVQSYEVLSINSLNPPLRFNCEAIYSSRAG